MSDAPDPAIRPTDPAAMVSGFLREAFAEPVASTPPAPRDYLWSRVVRNSDLQDPCKNGSRS